MQRISWTDRRSNEDILRTIYEKRTLLDTIKKSRWQMIGHTLRHGDELHSLIIEGMIEGTRSRGRPRARYINQIMQESLPIRSSKIWRMIEKDGEDINCENLLKTNLWIDKLNKKKYNIIHKQ